MGADFLSPGSSGKTPEATRPCVSRDHRTLSCLPRTAPADQRSRRTTWILFVRHGTQLLELLSSIRTARATVWAGFLGCLPTCLQGGRGIKAEERSSDASPLHYKDAFTPFVNGDEGGILAWRSAVVLRGVWDIGGGRADELEVKVWGRRPHCARAVSGFPGGLCQIMGEEREALDVNSPTLSRM